MVLGEYKLKQDFRAPSMAPDEKDELVFTTFHKDEVIHGFFKPKDMLSMDSPFLDLVVTTDGFVIPAGNVFHIRDVESSAAGQADPVATVENIEAAQTSVQADISAITSNTYVKQITTTANYSTHGAIAGGLLGAVYAMSKGKGVIVSVLVGAVLGGLIGKYIADNIDVTKYGLTKAQLSASGAGGSKAEGQLKKGKTLAEKQAELNKRKGK